MLAAYASRLAPHDPASALEIGDQNEPKPDENRTTNDVHVAQVPRILRTDAGTRPAVAGSARELPGQVTN